MQVSLRSDERGLVLSVVDNGVGLDAASVEDGNGLTSMRSRAERLGARFAISARIDGGTTVQLEVPHERLR